MIFYDYIYPDNYLIIILIYSIFLYRYNNNSDNTTAFNEQIDKFRTSTKKMFAL